MNTNAKIVVYSRPNCHYCDMLKNYLIKHEYIFEEKDVRADKATLTELKEMLPNVKTVPQVFINGIHVGGCRETLDFLEGTKQAV